MNIPLRSRWLPAAIGAGVLYLAIGLATADLAHDAASTLGRNRWRLIAWIASGITFVAQVAWERLRLRHSPRLASGHAALAVAVGAFGLAAAATIRRSLTTGVDGRYVIALVAWPLLTAIPAFVVAFLLSLMLRPTNPPAN